MYITREGQGIQYFKKAFPKIQKCADNTNFPRSGQEFMICLVTKATLRTHGAWKAL